MAEQYKSDEQLRREQFRGEQFGADEVELKDYLIVLWKWKWLIILGTFICAFTAGVVSFMLPKVYKITTIIQPPRVAFLNGGNVQLKELESPITLKGVIEGKTFDEQIMSELNLKEGEIPGIKITIPRDTTLIDLTTESEKPDQAKLVLEKLTSILREHYRDRINLEKDNIDTKIRELNIKIENLKNKINLTKEDLSVVLKQKEVVYQQLKETKERIDKLQSEREKAMSNNPNDSMAVLLYTNDMQINQRYYNDLQTRLTYDLELRERDLKKIIDDYQSQLESSQIQVESMKFLENNIQEFKIHKYPTIPERPIKPKKRLNVMIAFFVGGFFTVFLAFFLEYLSKIKLTPEERRI